MRIDQYINLGRLWLFMRNDVLAFYRTTLFSMGSLAAILLLFFLLSSVSGRSGGSYLSIFTLILFFGGFLFTSSSFNDLHHKHKCYLFLTLPGSNLEKFAGKLILTSVGYTLGAIIFFYLFTMLASGLNLLFFNRPLPLFNPFQDAILEIIGAYLVTQSMFLLGAVYFKSHAFIKTILAINGFFLLLILFALLVIWLLYRDYYAGRIWMDGLRLEKAIQGKQAFTVIAQILFWVFLAPFFWLVSYLRLRESEVQNGIS